MFERFEDKARDVVAAAQQEALRLQHNQINPEHILLGLLNEPDDDVAGQVLIEAGLTLNNLRSYLHDKFPPKAPGTTESLPFSTGCKRALEFALREALALGAKEIRTEHILLGVIREPKETITQVLDEFNIDGEQLREEILERVSREGHGREAVAAGAPSERRRRGSKKLATYARNLTALAREGKLDPCIGRETEIRRMMQILTRRGKNNPILVGFSGVGKTSIVEGFAQRVVNGEVPERLVDKEIYALDLASLVAGSKYRGEFEERLKAIMKEVIDNEKIMLFIDEIHTLVSAGAAEGALDAANILKPALARGELQTIGSTTYDEYKKYFEKDAALERRFQKVDVAPTTSEDTLEILKNLLPIYEKHHHVRFEPEAAEAAVDLSDKYISDRHLPDKAIDLIDEAASHVCMNDTNVSDVTRITKEIKDLREKRDTAVENEEFEQAYEYTEKEKALKQERQALAAVDTDDEAAWPIVTSENVAEVVGMWTGIQVKRLTAEETDRLRNMEGELHKRVISQEEAIGSISRSIRRAKAGLNDGTEPLGSFVFLGPSGVGKTELAKALAEFLFNDEKAMIRINMSEYAEKHNVSRLIGSPPGYVGYQEGGQLTDQVRRKPYSVVLLDEIEKAHEDVWNILLQLLDDGELTDGQGRTVNFRNTVVIMTSNIGARGMSKAHQGIGFSSGDDSSNYEAMKKKALEEYDKTLSPELRNRIDEVIVFSKLNEENIREIIKLLLSRLENLLATKGLKFELDDKARDLIIEVGFDPQMGARPLRRAIRRLVEEPLADQMLGVLKEDSTVVVTVDPEDEKKTQIEIRLPKAKRKTSSKAAKAADSSKLETTDKN